MIIPLLFSDTLLLHCSLLLSKNLTEMLWASTGLFSNLIANDWCSCLIKITVIAEPVICKRAIFPKSTLSCCVALWNYSTNKRIKYCSIILSVRQKFTTGASMPLTVLERTCRTTCYTHLVRRMPTCICARKTFAQVSTIFHRFRVFCY